MAGGAGFREIIAKLVFCEQLFATELRDKERL